MSQFEYIMVMVALILALALAQALRGLSEIVTSKNRYWPHTLWLVTMVFLIVQAWWANWDYNAVEEWRITSYLLTLAAPAISFAGVYFLVPATRSVTIDWREHFYAVKPWFFGLLLTYLLVAIIESITQFGTPVIHPYRIFQVLLIVIILAGAMSRNEYVHRSLPVLFLLILMFSQLLVRMNLGALMTR